MLRVFPCAVWFWCTICMTCDMCFIERLHVLHMAPKFDGNLIEFETRWCESQVSNTNHCGNCLILPLAFTMRFVIDMSHANVLHFVRSVVEKNQCSKNFSLGSDFTSIDFASLGYTISLQITNFVETNYYKH